MLAHRPRISNATSYSPTVSFSIDSLQVIEGSFTLDVVNEHPQEVRFEEMPGPGRSGSASLQILLSRSYDHSDQLSTSGPSTKGRRHAQRRREFAVMAAPTFITLD
jgi:hypothetical protein